MLRLFYFLLEALEGSCFYSTLGEAEEIKKLPYREVRLQGAQVFKKDLLGFLKELPFPIEIIR